MLISPNYWKLTLPYSGLTATYEELTERGENGR